MPKHRSMIIGIFILILGIIVACSEATTPTAAPTAVPVPAVDTDALVAEAVTAALAAMPTPAQGQSEPSAAEMEAQVQEAIAAAMPAQQPRVNPQDVQAAVAAALASLPTSAPTAAPTVAAPPEVKPSGTFNTGMTQIGAPVFLLKNQSFFQSRFDDTVTHEDLWWTDAEGSLLPRLVREWETSADGLVFTFHLQEGVPFHENWGEFNADDFLFTLNSVIEEGSVHTVTGRVRNMFFCDGCELIKIDNLTMRLSRPTPTVELTWNNRGTLAFRSKLHQETVGMERADTESIGTGPWKLAEAKEGQFRRVTAVEDHWRKTPEFAEMIWWEILEESTRLANFLVGRLDTGTFSADSLQAIKAENRPAIKYVSRPVGLQFFLLLHGQYYDVESSYHVADEEGNIARPLGTTFAENCMILPWVSCDPDTGSADWEKARKVREAMAISIDRQKLVNNLAFGDGRPSFHQYWHGHDSRLKQQGLESLTFEYDPDRARQLLTEAGYRDGVELDMTLTEASVAGPIAVGEAVATMWEEVGISSTQQVTPYSAWRPCTVARSCQAVATHASGGVPEPLRVFPIFWHPRSSISFGFEHPFFTDITNRALQTVDDESRWALQGEASKWIYDNVMTLPLYERFDIWPLGPNIDPWPLPTLGNSFIGNYEYVKHRQ